MTEKIQMTEEQARDLFKVVSFNGGSYEFRNLKIVKGKVV